MTIFHEIRKVLAAKAVGWRGDVSLWGVDTAFSRLYDRLLESKAMVREPAFGIRHDGAGVPDPFRSDYEILFPLAEGGGTGGGEVREIPGGEVACFVHRGPYEWIPCAYEKVMDWVRENGYEVTGSPREVFLVAPEPHSGGSQDDMLTEIQVPVRKAA